MTARVTTLKGSAAGEYYVHELPNYYLDSGEPRGVWLGKGAEALGLSGEVADAEFLNVMAGAYPDQPDLLLGGRYNEDSVRGFDVTASAPKSVSVLKEIGGATVEAHIAEAHDAAVASMGRWIEDHAHTRFRVNGQIHTVDAEGLIMATFRQHTSRALDPQLHTHVVIANKVQSPDGRWLALDARMLKKHQRGVSAHYHLVLRSELTDRLGVEWQPVENGIAEIAHVPELLLEEFSSRTDHINRRLDLKIDRFVDSMDREPTPREHWQLEREAVLDSRPTKSKDVSAHELRTMWNAQARDIGINPEDLARDVANVVRPRWLDNDTAIEVIDLAIERVSERSTWHSADLTREIAAAIPTDVVIPTDEIPDILRQLTDYAVEQCCVDISRPLVDGMALRRDGRPVTESPVDRVLTTDEILGQERKLLAWVERRMSHEPIDSAFAPERSVVPLSHPQAEAAAAVAGDAHLTLVVGPAGTGKTTALTPAVDQLRSEGRVVFGVAPSAAAADVLHRETGVEADTVDKLLAEHTLRRGPDHRFDLPAHATVIVDEAGMLSTAKLEQLADLADTRGWRIALVGDPMQFSAVGRGGMFEHLINTHGAIELDRVHRFAEPWEANASLRLRRGDETVADLYDQQGRLRGGTRTRMQSEALDAWWDARTNGETVVLATPNNDTVRQLNATAQQRRLDVGELSTRGRTIKASGHELHVGDEIVTRRNHRQLTTSQQQPVRNRDRWTIDTVHRNGGLTVSGSSGNIRLPADYVQAHVELGYAQTSHATQGRTVDRSILYLDGPTDARGIYVPMTRGRHGNDAYIATDPNHDALDIFAESISRNWIDQPAVARQAELSGLALGHRPGTLGAAELRSLMNRRHNIESDLAENAAGLRDLPQRIAGLNGDLAGHQRKLDALTDRVSAAENILARHDRPLRRRGHETQIVNAHRVVDQAPQQVQQLTTAIDGLNRDLRTAEKSLRFEKGAEKKRPALETELGDITSRLDDDRGVRSRSIRRDPHERIIETLGNRATGGEAARAWDRAAGQLDQHQSAYSIDEGVYSPAKANLLGSGYASSVTRTTDSQYSLHYAVQHQQQELSRHLAGPSLGISR